MTVLHAPLAWLADGWQADMRIEIGADGAIKAVSHGRQQPGDERVAGPLLPGMPNLHSHAFQRAMAGLAEEALNPEDSFWTWRELMYRLVGRLTPEQVQAIATHLYIEMMKGGYTSVAEFHYLHHQPGGAPYANLAEMAERIATAAETSGIGLTLLPAFYAHGGFGGKPLAEKQLRFKNDTDRYLTLIQGVDRVCKRIGADWGLCFHSLRAATEADIGSVLAAHRGERPIHIHIAEQTKEVEDCLAWSNRRPVEWLYDKVEIDKRWCLIHATHVTPDEVHMMGHSEAVVGLCPTTEANLGDGIFPAQEFLAANGAFGIGSDSHVSVSALEELRWLEYGQRLKHERRNRLSAGGRPEVADTLYAAALQGGAQAMGKHIGAIAAGKRADFIVLDGAHPMLASVAPAKLLGRWLFGGTDGWVRDVMVAGKWVVKDRHHAGEEAAQRAFGEAMSALMAA
ncbi:MAG TPA: formimidoylglutamate deiminase [Dongiaceae bacterium]|nr:formimidoylglutamate deiminase [Dongiaceae bacterium]